MSAAAQLFSFGASLNGATVPASVFEQMRREDAAADAVQLAMLATRIRDLGAISDRLRTPDARAIASDATRRLNDLAFWVEQEGGKL